MRKAIATAFTQLIELLMLVGLSTVLVAMLSGRHADIQTITKENDIDSNTITIANAFISNPLLTYKNNGMTRGVLEKDVLDILMTKKADFISSWERILYEKTTLSNTMSYQDSYLLITIIDLDSNDGWIASLSQNKIIADCLVNGKKQDVSKLFERVAYPWEIFDLSKCDAKYSKIASTFEGLPVSIKYSDGIHTGLVRVWLVEV